MNEFFINLGALLADIVPIVLLAIGVGVAVNVFMRKR